MDEIIGRLVELYVDLTDSNYVFVSVSKDRITVLIVSDWFKLQDKSERLEYLVEGLQVACPELIPRYSFRFLAYTKDELERIKTPLAS